MRGMVGELRNGYQVAARLGAWSMEENRLEARALSVEEFWLDGQLSLWLAVGSRAWVWRAATLADASGRPLVVHVDGSPEVRNQPASFVDR